MAEKKVPLRKCLGCNLQKPKKELIRVLRTPEGNIIIDRTGRQNGRGAYLCDNTECLAKLRKNGALDRVLDTHIPTEIYDALLKEMSN